MVTPIRKEAEMRRLTLGTVAALVALQLAVGAAFANPDPLEAQPLTVGKDASGEYNNTYAWTISKDVDKTVVAQFGGTATFTYSVGASHDDGASSDVKVTGTITVSNPNAADVALDAITDELGGADCNVDTGGNLTVGPGDTSFSYECALNDTLPTDAVANTATVTWSEQLLSDGSHLAAGSADFTTGAVTFTPNEDDECVYVSDPVDPNSPREFCVGNSGEVDNSFSFRYSRDIPVPHWNCQSYDNTAMFETSDSGRIRTASRTVTVCGPTKTGAVRKVFWASMFGRAIIRDGETTGGVCNSGTWLRQYNPFNDLKAAPTCKEVAAYVFTVITRAHTDHPSMNPMLKAEMLATALNVYFSDAALGGNKIKAPTAIGGVNVDLRRICSDQRCRKFEDASPAFPSNADGKMSVLQLLVDASNASNSGGSLWFGNVKATQELAKDTFEAVNIEKVFGG